MAGLPRCELDSTGCVQLSSILESFNAPISEEQAWAVCHEAVKCLINEWKDKSNQCYRITSTKHVYLHKDGIVDPNTATSEETTRTKATSEFQLVSSLGLTLFNALDYGLCDDEERTLSEPLEMLIDRMTSEPDDEAHNVDEGIERDAEDDRNESGGMTLTKVLEVCIARLSSPTQAESHYKAVIRALVAEVLELSFFLEKVVQGTKQFRKYLDAGESDSNLDTLKIKDWACLWKQVIRELRQGVKLKKVDFTPHPIEFELTPYEMLLDDIRSRRYKLRQVRVNVNENLPKQVKKDARAVILEFIRSRPPLVPVSRRKLKPLPPRQLTLYEKLMVSLKQQHNLKPTPPRMKKASIISASKKNSNSKKEEESEEELTPRRRLIKADLSLCLPDFNDSNVFQDPDEYDLPPTPLDIVSEPQSPIYSSHNKKEVAWEFPFDQAPLKRRHSISGCRTSSPMLGKSSSQNHTPAVSPALTPSKKYDSFTVLPKSKLECLTLSLEEVVHIRHVLTKAELESMLFTSGGSSPLYEELLKGKVCFTCKETRFTFFGSKGTKCKLCERIVCDNCSTRMRLPKDDFNVVPVALLSPTPSPTNEEEPQNSKSFWRFPESFGISSLIPKSKKPNDSYSNISQSNSFHILSNNNESADSWSTPIKSTLKRSKTITKQSDLIRTEEKQKGPLMPICRECKYMVSHIVGSSKRKRQKDSRKSLPMTVISSLYDSSYKTNGNSPAVVKL